MNEFINNVVNKIKTYSSGRGRGGVAMDAIRRGRVKSSQVPLAALGIFFLSPLCNAEFS